MGENGDKRNSMVVPRCRLYLGNQIYKLIKKKRMRGFDGIRLNYSEKKHLYLITSEICMS